MISTEQEHTYVFDVKLFATFTVKAQNENQARSILKDTIECADCNGGVWPDGTPVLFEASIDGEPDLNEVDSESTL